MRHRTQKMKNRGKVDPMHLKAAVVAVRSKAKTLRGTARHWDIPKSTLFNYVKLVENKGGIGMVLITFRELVNFLTFHRQAEILSDIYTAESCSCI